MSCRVRSSFQLDLAGVRPNRREYSDRGARPQPSGIRAVPPRGCVVSQVINIAGLARAAATTRTTVEGCLGILHDTFVATPLWAFEAKLRARERQHLKLYCLDSGLARAIKQQRGRSSPKNAVRCSNVSSGRLVRAQR